MFKTDLQKLTGLLVVIFSALAQIVTMSYCFGEAQALGIPNTLVETNVFDTVRVGTILLVIGIVLSGVVFLLGQWLLPITHRLMRNHAEIFQEARFNFSMVAVAFIGIVLGAHFMGQQLSHGRVFLMVHDEQGDKVILRK